MYATSMTAFFMFVEMYIAESDALGPGRVCHPLDKFLDSLGSADMDDRDHCYVSLAD